MKEFTPEEAAEFQERAREYLKSRRDKAVDKAFEFLHKVVAHGCTEQLGISHDNGDEQCFFCEANFLDKEPHKDDCLYVSINKFIVELNTARSRSSEPWGNSEPSA
jgi:hypothetical protein